MAFFPDKKTSVHVCSDASGSFWCGVFSLHSGWFQLQWPASWSAIEIAAKELVPMVAAAAAWDQTWGGCRVIFHVDNMAVVSVLQRQAPNDLLLTHYLTASAFMQQSITLSFPQPTLLAARTQWQMRYLVITCHYFLCSFSRFPTVPYPCQWWISCSHRLPLVYTSVLYDFSDCFNRP